MKILNEKIKEKWGKEAEELHEENKDGAFLMSWKDFIDVWSNISICKKFAESWEGVRFFGEWDEKTSGGTPTSNDPKLFDAYLKNP